MYACFWRYSHLGHWENVNNCQMTGPSRSFITAQRFEFFPCQSARTKFPETITTTTTWRTFSSFFSSRRYSSWNRPLLGIAVVNARTIKSVGMSRIAIVSLAFWSLLLLPTTTTKTTRILMPLPFRPCPISVEVPCIKTILFVVWSRFTFKWKCTGKDRTV